MNDKAGLVFHIIHGSFVDGYGVRTTIFLKGCPLRCIWCCNPEGQVGHPEIKFTPSECDGCGRCMPICPVDAIRINSKPEANIEIDRELCTNCGKCIEVCYKGALSWFGRDISVDELFDIVRKDEQFYRASGGGVTIGGGEPTFQPHFTYALLKKCKENYIHIAMDTCGFTTTELGFKILEEADLLLFDLKGMASKEHIKYTSVSNQTILKNLKKLDAMEKSIIIRVPIVPGYTDSPENIESTALFLAGLRSVERVDLIGYHEFGVIKYLQLGKEYKLQHVHPLTEKRLNEISQVFKGYGLDVQLGG